MIAAYKGHKEIVKLLLEHEPALQDLDKFGKTAADKAQSTAIAALIQSSLLKAQFVEQRGSRDTHPRFFTPHKPRQQLVKSVRHPVPTQKSPRASAKKSVGKLVQSVGHSKATELLDGFMGKMKRKVNSALERELARELSQQLDSADGELQKALCDDFCQQSKTALHNAVWVFNSQVAEALHKRGLEVTADLKLEIDDALKLLQDVGVDCNYSSPNPSLLSTLKASSRILASPHKRVLSPSRVGTRQSSSEPQFGLDLIGYLGTQFEQMSTELRQALRMTIASAMQQAFGQLKAVYLSSNKTSFDFLKRDLLRKLDSTLKEKLTRAELRQSLASAKHKRGPATINACLSPSLTDRAHSSNRSQWTGTLWLEVWIVDSKHSVRSPTSLKGLEFPTQIEPQSVRFNGNGKGKGNGDSDGDGDGNRDPDRNRNRNQHQHRNPNQNRNLNLNLEFVSAHHAKFMPAASFASREAIVSQSACFQRRPTGCL